eukprot:4447160-Ditylum_brightwellii.AAC.1
MFVTPLEKQNFHVSSYAGLPCIVSTDCTGTGVIQGTDKGVVCFGCKSLCQSKGSSNPSTNLNLWCKKLSHCIECRKKGVLTITDLQDACNFVKNSNEILTVEGRQLKEEAAAQVKYCEYMLSLSERLSHKSYDSIGESSAPGLPVLFKEAVTLYKKNPTFWDSLKVALLKGAAVREKYGGNARLGEKVANFYRFVTTYSKTVANLVSANLLGTSSCWLEKLNSQEHEPCIINSGKDG